MFFTSFSQQATTNRMMMEAMAITRNAMWMLGAIAIIALLCLLVVLIKYYKPTRRKKKSHGFTNWVKQIGEKNKGE